MRESCLPRRSKTTKTIRANCPKALSNIQTRAAHFHVKVLDPAWHYLYGPSVRAVMRIAVALNQLQFLTIRSYLSLVFATLVLLLLVVAAWR